MSAATRLRLAILDGYGVRWTHTTFARDILQNFFDAAPDLGQVTLRVDAAAGTVDVAGPVAFDLDLLAYVGATTKHDGQTAGGFGEGFKVCALVGVRDFGLTMSAGSGGLALDVVLDPVPLGRELCYDVRAVDPPVAGSWVHLAGCDDATLAAFDEARFAFRDATNPRLGAPIAQTPDGRIAVLASPLQGRGEIYYRRQRRGGVRFYYPGAVTLCHDPPLPELDGDRDRRDLTARPIAEAIGRALPEGELWKAIAALERFWDHGHDVLMGLLVAAIERKLTFRFPSGWLARSERSGSRGRDALVERLGYQLALATFAKIGMPTAQDQISGDLATRPADALERARIGVLSDLYAGLSGRKPKVRTFEVFDDPRAAVRGQHLGDRVLVDARLLAAGFDAVVGTVLHELAHEAGGEEADPFLGRLRTLLGAVLADPGRVRAARARYAEVTAADAPVPPEPTVARPPEPRAFLPERAIFKLSKHAGPVIGIHTSAAFPGLVELRERLAAAIAAAGGGAVSFMIRRTVDDADAIAHGIPGVPTIVVDDVDIDPDSVGPPGLYLRVRADGDYLPSTAQLTAALAAAHARPRRKRETSAVSPHQQRAYALAEKRRSWFPEGYGLEGVWGSALAAAADRHLARVQPDDPRDADTIWTAVDDEVTQAVEHARALRRADPDLDDADALERDAMAAAQGLAVAVYDAAREAGAEGAGAAEAASAAFRRMRAITARVLDAQVEARLKSEVLFYVVSGKSSRYTRGIGDLDGLEARAERGLVAARWITRLIAEEGREAGVFFLEAAIPADDAEAVAAERVLREAESARRATADRLARDAVKAAWDEALARGEDRLAAARAAIASAVAQVDVFRSPYL